MTLYFEVDKDPEVIKWLNDHLVPIMSQDFIPDQVVKNSCDLCIGTSWADYEGNQLPYDASVEYITSILDNLT